MKKSQGNVVCFRNLKPATDKAIELFANKNAIEEIILAPYEDYVGIFDEAVTHLYAITPTLESVDDLLTEEDEARFIKAFRELIRIKNVLECFTQFSFDDLDIDEQTFADYRSKYLDLYQKVKADNEKEKVSILDDLDFEIELITRDKINVSYIISLLQNMKDAKPADQAKLSKGIMNILDGDAELRSKRELIERFINDHFPNIPAGSDVTGAFDEFWEEERQKAIKVMCEDEGLKVDGFEKILSNYLFTEKVPLRDDIIGILNDKPSLRERKTVAERVIGKIKDFVGTFVEGVD